MNIFSRKTCTSPSDILRKQWTKLPKEEAQTVRDLYAHGMSAQEIRDHMQSETWNLDAIKRTIGIGHNISANLPLPYITDDKKRAEKIKELSNTRGKTYTEILYLNFLRGETSKSVYENAINERRAEDRAKKEEDTEQSKREWGE